MEKNLLVLLAISLFFLFPRIAHADTHGYGQGVCSAGSICYTGPTTGTVKPRAQCGNLTDWHYGYDVNSPSDPAKCFFGYCCDSSNPTPTPTPDPNTVRFQGKPPSCLNTKDGGCTQVDTAIGTISTDPTGLVKTIFSILLSLSGGVALLLIIGAGYQLMTSQGNPEKVKEARERLTAAIVGLIFIIFSIAILQIIGVDILHIPGLTR